MEARGFPTLLIEDEVVTGGSRLEEAIDGIGLEPPVGHRLALELLDDLVDLDGLGIAVGEKTLHRAFHAQVLAQEHLEVEIGEDMRERDASQHVRIEIGRPRHGTVRETADRARP
jgi:hypothetical protein